MEYIDLKNNTYGFVSDFKDDPHMRMLFNMLTEATYGFNFEFWYEEGLWGDQYIPYSLVHDGKMVSNVSISKIEFIIENENKLGIQIGTVMTDKAYRHRGLNKFLLERVISEWKDQCDFIYLFANDTVLDFYPKFNFERVDEYQYSKTLSPTGHSLLSRKLNMDNNEDKDVLLQTVNDAIPVAKVAMRNNAALIMFYCLSFMKNNIYYLEKLKAVVIANLEGDTLYINDVFCEFQVDLREVIQMMSDKTVKRVVLGFTPLDETGFQKSLLKPEDTLFVYKDQANIFKNSSWRFPVLSHA